jgi:hypothetical protein
LCATVCVNVLGRDIGDEPLITKAFSIHHKNDFFLFVLLPKPLATKIDAQF